MMHPDLHEQLINTSSLIDVSKAEGMARLKDKLTAAKGKCLLGVHMFSSMDTRSKQESKDEFTSRTRESKSFLNRVMQNEKDALPLLMFVETDARLRDTHLSRHEYENLISRDMRRFKATMNGISYDQNHPIFYIMTAKGTPIPLDDYRANSSDDKFESFISRLVSCGLRRAYIAGTKFSGDNLSSNFRKPGELPTYADHMGRSALSALASYNQTVNQLHVRHPLRFIDPDGCVPTVFRALKNKQIPVYYTRYTYPYNLSRSQV